MENEKTYIPKWFWFVAVFFLLWNIVGVLSFLGHTFITEEALAQLPEKERALYGDYPVWTTIVFAIAVFTGMIGTIGLVMRKRWARPAFMVSLLAIIPQMIHNVFFTGSIEVYGTLQAVTMPVLVVVFGAFLVWFSNSCNKRGWMT